MPYLLIQRIAVAQGDHTDKRICIGKASGQLILGSIEQSRSQTAKKNRNIEVRNPSYGKGDVNFSSRRLNTGQLSRTSFIRKPHFCLDLDRGGNLLWNADLHGHTRDRLIVWLAARVRGDIRNVVNASRPFPYALGVLGQRC